MIYLDYNATCPTTKEHLALLVETMAECDFNPSSIHCGGRKAKSLLRQARKDLAHLISAVDAQIFFSSGATESNTWAIAEAVRRKPNGTLFAGATEHKSVIESAKRYGSKVVILPVHPSGKIDLEKMAEAIRSEPEIAGFFIMHVNNETGVINDIQHIAETAKALAPDAVFHCDMVQALGKLDLTFLANSEIDSASFSGHKIGAIKGVGASYIKQPAHWQGLIVGGGQERGLRSGTENLMGAVSFGMRAKHIAANPNWLAHCRDLQRSLFELITKIPGGFVHGDLLEMVPTTLNFHIEGVASEALMLECDLNRICVATGSACSSGTPQPSHVLLAMGIESHAAANSLRISFGACSLAEDVEKLSKVILRVAGL